MSSEREARDILHIVSMLRPLFSEEAPDDATTLQLLFDRDRYCAIHAAFSSTPTDVAAVPLEKLKEIEWSGWDETLQVQCCPACLTTKGLGDSHAPGCWLDAAIRG
jgi:hypothetical protein